MSMEATRRLAVLNNVEAFPSLKDCADYLGDVTVDGLRTWAKRQRAAGVEIPYRQPGTRPKVEVSEVSEVEAPEALWARRETRYKQYDKHKQSKKERVFHMPDNKPFGLLVFGDPHVDDDGTDLETLRKHMELTQKVEGLWGVNLGDTTNNWIGRLARLYAQQGTTASEAWVLAEHFIRNTNWLFMISGNHDAWSGSGDPIQWIARQIDVPYDGSVRARIKTKGGHDFVIHARHDFKGHSMWNPTHGVAKAAQMGDDADVLVCGHTHVSGYQVVKQPRSGKVSHAVQVASYKIHDRYADELGLRDQHISPCALIVFDPQAQNANEKVHVFWNPRAGVKFLNALRQEVAA